MAVVVRDSFVLRAAAGGDEIRPTAPLLASTALGLLKGDTHLYAHAALAPLLEHASLSSLDTTVASGSAREVALRSAASFGVGRKTARVVVDSEALDWQVEIWDSTRTTSLGSATNTTTTRAAQATTITLASTGQSVIVEVQVKRQGGASPGKLYAVRVLEDPVVAADLPA